MRVALLLLSLLSLAALTSAALFEQRPMPPWNPRVNQGWSFPTSAFNYKDQFGVATTLPPNGYALAWGGGLYNDTYVSTDGGLNWVFVGGTAAYVNAVTGKVAYNNSLQHPATFTCDDSGCCKAYDSIKSEWYVMDKVATYYSSNGLDWQTKGGQEYYTRTNAYCLVDLSSNLYIIGGQNNTNTAYYENDIWWSRDQAQTFSQRSVAPFSQRDSMAGYVHDAPLPTGKQQVLYAIGGHAQAEDVRPNEVWVSSDSAATWTLLTKAPFAGRDHFKAVITSKGAMIMAGGKLDAFNAQGSHLGANDVWASLDGGATWGSCGLAEWPVRQDYGFAIDSQDYLFISGGSSINQTGPKVTLNDVWRSVGTWSSVDDVAAWCNLTVPACGVGLRCWPNATTYTTGTAPTETYPIPTAAAYNCPCSSSSGGSSTGGSGGNGGRGSNGAASTSQLSVVVGVVLAVLSFVAHVTL